MKLALVTDAWHPQVNGVVRTLGNTKASLEAIGFEVILITPDQFRSMPCPSYPEIRLALTGSKTIGQKIMSLQPDALHIATEGPLGWSVASLSSPFVTESTWLTISLIVYPCSFLRL